VSLSTVEGLFQLIEWHVKLILDLLLGVFGGRPRLFPGSIALRLGPDRKLSERVEVCDLSRADR